MTLVLNGTTGVSAVDGTASTPAIQGNDTNTGIFFPAADTVAASAGGTAVWNASSTFGYKNSLINGNFDIWQRGTSFTLAASAIYTADRWQVGGATGSVSRQAFTNGQTDVPGNPAYYAQWVISSNSQNYEFVQKVENVRTFSGQTVTATFYARRTTGSISISPRLVQYFGTGGSPSATTVTSLGSMTLTSSWQKFTFTATVPSISGKTIGSNNDDSLWLSFQINDTNTGTIEFAQMQLEAGPIGTSFDVRPIGTELLLCQRYYQRYNSTAYTGIFGGIMYSTVLFLGPYQFVTPMRASPSMSYSALGDWAVIVPGSGVAPTSLTFDSITPNSARVNAATPTLTTGGAYIQAQNGSAWLAFAAEL